RQILLPRQEFLQQRPGDNIDAVGAALVTVDMLLERATKIDVEQLFAATDAENRQTSPPRCVQQCQFKIRALLDDLPDFAAVLLAVMTRMNVQIAAGND